MFVEIGSTVKGLVTEVAGECLLPHFMYSFKMTLPLPIRREPTFALGALEWFFFEMDSSVLLEKPVVRKRVATDLTHFPLYGLMYIQHVLPEVLLSRADFLTGGNETREARFLMLRFVSLTVLFEVEAFGTDSAIKLLDFSVSQFHVGVQLTLSWKSLSTEVTDVLGRPVSLVIVHNKEGIRLEAAIAISADLALERKGIPLMNTVFVGF
jgi:hypothetical protein